MKKIMVIALAAIMVIGCSFCAWAYNDPNTDTTGTVDINTSETLTDNGTTDGASTGKVDENKGTIVNNNTGSTVATNDGTITNNHGSVTSNKETITNNDGVVDINSPLASGAVIETNEEKGTVTLNDQGGRVNDNFGTVIQNSGEVKKNEEGGKVTTNDGTVITNEGTVDKNGTNQSATVQTNNLTGVVTNDTNGKVYYNYGTVKDAKIDADGKTIVYDNAGGTVYGVTYVQVYSDGYKNIYSNEQIADGSTEANTYKVLTAEEANASRKGYKFVNWVLKTATAADLAKYTTTKYVGGEEVKVVSAMWLEAQWEKLSDDAKKAITGGGAVWSSVPVTYGSSSAPITLGRWAKNTDGSFTYYYNGEQPLNNRVWIKYNGTDGKEYSGCFYFDKNGTMQTGWKQIDGEWYYFDETEGNTQGMMKTSTITPDGYMVDASGKWIKEA